MYFYHFQIVNEMNGGVSACLMWPGCGISYQRMRETFSLSYKPYYTFESLLDASLSLLQNKPKTESTVVPPATSTSEEQMKLYTSAANVLGSMQVTNLHNENKPPSLIMLYYPEPDGIGHKYGTNSTLLGQTLHQVTCSSLKC